MVSLFRSLGVAACILAGSLGGPGAAAADGFIWYPGQGGEPREEGNPWFSSNFSIQLPSFRTAWRTRAISLREKSVVLFLRPAPEDEEKDFIGAEVQRRQPTHYGRYEVVMTAARGEGVISSFFTYTGPWFKQPHDEIDIEFLGRDTTKLWAMAFQDGRRLPGEALDLGFDAAEAPHLYAFEWFPDRIVWYADGREIFRMTDEDGPLPSTPGKLMVNIWAGGEGQRNWSGTAPDDMVASARYYCISHQPLEAESPQCSDRFAGE